MLLQDKHVKNLKKWVEDGDYCFLCDNHPSSGHDDDCPLSEAAQQSVQADEGDSSGDEEFTNPYLLSGEELDRAIALRR